MSDIGKGIAIAGIWIGLGVSIALGNLSNDAIAGLSVAAAVSTTLTALWW